jgi:hypothetical protein
MRMLLVTLFISGTAYANPTHEINTAPVRGFVRNQLVDTTTHVLRLGPALDPNKLAPGITALAARKAAETLRGMTGFNRSTEAGNYVQTMGKEKLILTASAPGQKVDSVGGASTDNEQEFVLRTGKNGIVVGRGNLDQTTGKLTFTRSHNEGGELNGATK